jgi:hypothetical protein
MLFDISTVPMPDYSCYDEEAGDDMYHHPEGLQEQCYPSFAKCQDRNVWAIVIRLAHDMSSSPGPDAF